MDMTNPPGNENPQVPPVAPGAQPPVPPIVSEASWDGPPSVPVKPKLKTDVGFLVLGLVTPVVIAGFLLFASNFTSDLVWAFSPALLLLLFFVFLGLFIVGRSTGNVRLRSYGKGGMWAYAAIPLFLLLAFGTCLIGGLPV